MFDANKSGADAKASAPLSVLYYPDTRYKFYEVSLIAN